MVPPIPGPASGLRMLRPPVLTGPKLLQLLQWWGRAGGGGTAMDPDHSVKTRNFLVTVFRTFDVSNDGRLSRAEVDRVLAALGRRYQNIFKTIIKIVKCWRG